MAEQTTDAAWAELVRVFDPFKPLADSLDQLYVEREDAPSRRIARELGIGSDFKSKFVLIGARGSGKTTELWRLARLVEGDRYVIGIDLSLSGLDDPSAFEVVLLIAMRLLRDLKTVRKDEAAPLEVELNKVYASAKRADTKNDLGIDDGVKIVGGSIAALAGVPGPGAAGVGAAAGMLAKVTRHVLAQRRARRDVEDTDAGAGLLEVFQRIVERLEAVIEKPVLVLVDGLDMVFDPERIYPIFVRAPFLAAAPVAFVLVGPISVLPSPQLVNALRSRMKIERLPNLRLYHRLADGKLEATTDAEDGFAKLLAARAREVGFEDDLFTAEALSALTAASGGVVRGFVRLVQDSLISAERKATLGAGDVKRTIDRERLELQSAVQKEDTMKVLVATLRRALLPGEPPGRAEELLYEGYILHHEDGESWYRPHEILVPIVERYAERADGA